jgi:hypothetical protein
MADVGIAVPVLVGGVAASLVSALLFGATPFSTTAISRRC